MENKGVVCKMNEKYMEDKERINMRVMQMEKYFDAVQDILNKKEINIYEEAEIIEMIRSLRLYQESGQWLKDFECDEQGRISFKFKRGVLSEDGLYNLLNEIDRIYPHISD